MTDYTITNATVEYSRVVRPADFESKTARIAWSVSFPEDADPERAALLTGSLLTRAQAEVHAKLGITRPKTEPEVKSDHGPAPAAAPAAVTDPMAVAVVEPAEVDEVVEGVTDQPKEVPLALLHQTATALVNSGKANGKTINALLSGKFSVARMSDVPAERRGAFLTELQALGG